MGAKQIKNKKTEDNEQQQDLPKSLSYQSYHEGTSVDGQTGSSTEEIQPTLPPLAEEYSVEELDPVMTGLPGEVTPEMNVSFHLDDKAKTEMQESLISKLQDKSKSESLNETKLDTGSSYSIEATHLNISVNLGDDPSVSFKTDCSINTDKDCSEASKDINSDAVGTSRQHKIIPALPRSSEDANMIIHDSVSETKNVTVDCKHDRGKSLQDIKLANENRGLPLHFDSGGQLKKKVTTENEDNRCKCELADHDCANNAFHKTIFTNVIFLPDKSKGASPKRYGPKRLGSIYDGLSYSDNEKDDDEDDNDKIIQNLVKQHDIEKSSEQNLETLIERNIQRDIVESSMSKEEMKDEDSNKESLKVNRSEQKSTDESMEVVTPDRMNDSANLVFVEDHFGLYTGSLAEGISKEFQTQGECKESNNQSGCKVLGKVSSSDMNEENSNNESKPSENDKSSFSSNAFEYHQPIQGQEEPNKPKIEHFQCLSSGVLSMPIAKAENELEPCKKKEKSMDSFSDKTAEQEVVEVCKICKEPRDLCFCLFSSDKTVMSVYAGRQNKPHFSYMRYLKINDKEINWSVLKSGQALFIKKLKSYKTDISDDNRVAFEFCLPTFKGSVGPQQTYRTTTEHEGADGESDSPLDKTEGLILSIKNKFGVDLSSFKLSSSIDSSRNIMINDFDECSDDDEVSVNDYDDANSDGSCKNENVINEPINSVEEMSENCEGKITCHDETSQCLEGDECSVLENGFSLECQAEHLHKKQTIRSSGFDCEHVWNRDKDLNSKSKSELKEENVKSQSEEIYSCSRYCDNGDQVQTLNSFEGCTSHAATSAHIYDLPETGNNVCSECDDKAKFDLTEEENEIETEASELCKDEDLVRDLNEINSNSLSYKGKNSSVDNRFEDNKHNLKCEFASQERVKCLSVEDVEENFDDEITEEFFSNGNTFEHENESDEGVSSSYESDENSEYDNLALLFKKEKVDESKAYEASNTMSYANKINDNLFSVSCPVLDTGNKSCGNITREINSWPTGMKDNSYQEVAFQTEKSKVHDDIKEVRENADRKSEQLVYLHKDIGTGSCENQVEKIDITETDGDLEHCESRQNVSSDQHYFQTSVVEGQETINEGWENIEMAQQNLEMKNKNVTDDLNSQVNETNESSLKNKKGMKMNLAYKLRRKETGVDIDNRLVEISSDEEDEDEITEEEYVANVKKEEKYANNHTNGKKEESEMMRIPFKDGSGEFVVLKSTQLNLFGGARGPSLSGASFIQHSGDGQPESVTLPSLLSDMLPSDLLPSQLSDHLEGLRNKLHVPFLEKPRHSKRHRIDRRPSRPDTAKSEFASSFYESFDRNVDFSQLGSRSESSQYLTPETNEDPSNNLDSERDSLKRQAAERIVHEYDSSSVSSSSVSLQSSRSGTPVPYSDTSSNDGMDGVKLNGIWNSVLEEEKRKCLKSSKIPPSYRCTVLCVDVSASMQGSPWQQVRDFIPEFLSGLGKKKQTQNIEEYVAMVTFGYRTSIVSQPTNNYMQLSRDLKSIKPDGNSPLLPGIALSLLIQTVRKELGQRHCKLHDVILRHRIILLSDGRPSPTSQVSLSDSISDRVQQEACQEVETSLEDWKLPAQHIHIDCVPVGRNPNRNLLKSICQVTNGRMVNPSDVKVLVNSTYNHYIAAQLSKQMNVDQLDIPLLKSLVRSLYPESSQADISEMVDLTETTHARLLAQRLDGSDSMSTEGEDDVHFERTDVRELPQIGTRVVLGPDKSYRLSRLEVEKGTVTGHSRKHNGKVFVQWDNGANTLCNCGFDDQFEVLPQEGVDRHKIDDPMEIGLKVRRGPDWKYGNQDGGGDQLGTVHKIEKNGTVLVKWPNGRRHRYRYNQSGIFDILISDPSDPLGIKMFESEMNKRNRKRTNTPVQLPEADRGTTQLPEADKGTTQLREADKGTTQLPEADRGTTQLPETHKGTTQLPEANRDTTQFPEADNVTNQLPEANRETTQLPEADRDTTQLPEADKGTTQLQEGDRGATQLPEADNVTTQLPEADRVTTQLPISNRNGVQL